jgi:hypothetical protein
MRLARLPEPHVVDYGVVHLSAYLEGTERAFKSHRFRQYKFCSKTLFDVSESGICPQFDRILRCNAYSFARIVSPSAPTQSGASL